MHLRRVGLTAAAALVLAVAAPASADTGQGGQGNGTQGSSPGGCNFTASSPLPDQQSIWTHIICTGGNAGSGGGGQTATADWTPPPCWWEPMTIDELHTEINRVYFLLDHGNEDPQARAQLKAVEAKITQNDPGNWYQEMCDNSATPADANGFTGFDGTPWLFAPPNPPVTVVGRPVVNPELLAEIAGSHIQIPDTALQFSPDPATGVRQTVDLPMWIWSAPGAFAPISATASINWAGINMSSTVTASATEVDLTVSGPDASATAKPCAIKPGGTVGTPWHKGAGANSDCSITFLKATPDAPDTLTATVTWTINWNQATGNGWPKQDTITENVPNIGVAEVQTIVVG